MLLAEPGQILVRVVTVRKAGEVEVLLCGW